ncbi:hypothetical protein KI809_01095 [Geobacter pelophilus]|uniref:Uncharacterized protein n=1 Tax=Geoanaerobacter pelophilus TaxID=60036 RepID=A0AAW4KZA2_9BACT|nr:hypothetical protein [Geoanaerobacter pelophilus]
MATQTLTRWRATDAPVFFLDCKMTKKQFFSPVGKEILIDVVLFVQVVMAMVNDPYKKCEICGFFDLSCLLNCPII